MSSLGEGDDGCDITLDERAPCPRVFATVVCLEDYGELQTSDGSSVNLCVFLSLRSLCFEQTNRRNFSKYVVIFHCLSPDAPTPPTRCGRSTASISFDRAFSGRRTHSDSFAFSSKLLKQDFQLCTCIESKFCRKICVRAATKTHKYRLCFFVLSFFLTTLTAWNGITLRSRNDHRMFENIVRLHCYCMCEWYHFAGMI